jgi:hypothetical protein
MFPLGDTCEVYKIEIGDNNEFIVNNSWDDNLIKPILRPLSDLNNFGEDIINEHFINSSIVEVFKLDYGIFNHYKGDVYFEIEGDSDIKYDSPKCLNFEVAEFTRNELLKGHFDVFGLIDKGLAIDINTLKQ